MIKINKNNWLDTLQYRDGGNLEDPVVTVDLPAVAISAQGNHYPYYGKLTQEEQNYFNQNNPIGRAIRAKASKGETPNAQEIYNVLGKDLVGIPVSNVLNTLQIPQSLMVEGIEAIEGNPYNLTNVFPTYGSYETNQRVPSDTFLKNTNPVLQFVGDVIIDPLNLIGGKIIKNPLNKTINKLSNYIDETIVTPIKYKKQIKELKDLKKQSKAFWKSEEGKRRLVEIGIEPDKMKIYKLRFNQNIPTSFYLLDNTLNINFKQLDELLKEGFDITPKAALSHEEAHYLQKEFHKQNKHLEHKKEIENMIKTLKKELKNEDKNSINYKIKKDSIKFYKKIKNKSLASPTKIDDNLHLWIIPKEEVLNKASFFENFDDLDIPTKSYVNWEHRNNLERFAQLRELRQDMIDKKYINNLEDYIDDNTLLKYLQENPKNRISSFLDPFSSKENSFNNLQALRINLNKAPALIPAIGLTGIGATQINNKKHKYGGWLDTIKYQNGGNLTSHEQQLKDEITGDAVPIKSAIAYGSAFGNPAVKKMVAPVDNPYIFTGNEPYTTPDMKGEYGTHYMFSQGNYAIPTIQQGLDGLFYNENTGPSDREAIRFRTQEEADRFARRYKEFSPAFKYKEGGWLDNL